MKTTANYGLKKPEGTDVVDIQNFNDNADTIDAELKKRVTTSDYIRSPGYAVDTGTANAYVVTLNPAPTAYADGMAVTVKIKTTNTGASTLNINGLGAKAILDSHGNVLIAGKLKAGLPYTFRYNGTNFILQGEGGEYGTATPDYVANTVTFGTEQGVKQGAMDLKAENIREGINYAGIVGNLSPRNNVEYIYVKNGYYLRSPFFADDNWFESTASVDNLYKMNINGTIIQTVPKPTSLGDFLTASKNHILTYNSSGSNGLALCNTSGTLLKSISGITLNVTNAYIDEDNSRVIIYNNTTKAVEVYDFDLNLLASKSLNVDEIVIFIPMAYYVLIYTDAESGVNLLSKSNTFTKYLMYLDKSLVF
jgi:hypothetical protein